MLQLCLHKSFLRAMLSLAQEFAAVTLRVFISTSDLGF